MTSPTDALVLRDVVVEGQGVDCLVSDGVVTALGPDLPVPTGAEVIDGAGGELLPGLHDHHVHVLAAAAEAGSWRLPDGRLPASSTGLRGTIADPSATGWLRVVGLDAETIAEELDRLWPSRPVRVQHRSGASWVLNSAAIEQLADVLDPVERRDGRVWRGDDRLSDALRELDPRDPAAALRRWGAALAGTGVTGLTDATPGLAPDALALVRAHVTQRTVSLGAEDDGLPVKIVVGDHHAGTGDADRWTSLIGAVQGARADDRPVAVHAVTAQSLALAVAAIESSGVVPGDRIEHAAVCDDDAARRLADLGVVVVTQPSVAARRGRAMLDEADPVDRPWLWRVRALRDLGVRVVLSSDAPYGDPDPWSTIRLASAGLPPSRSPWVADQAIPARDALDSYLTRPDDPAGRPRRVEPGAPADLCLLDGRVDDVLARVVGGDASSPVVLTVVGGRVVSRRPGCSAAPS